METSWLKQDRGWRHAERLAGVVGSPSGSGCVLPLALPRRMSSTHPELEPEELADPRSTPTIRGWRCLIAHVWRIAYLRGRWSALVHYLKEVRRRGLA